MTEAMECAKEVDNYVHEEKNKTGKRKLEAEGCMFYRANGIAVDRSGDSETEGGSPEPEQNLRHLYASGKGRLLQQSEGLKAFGDCLREAELARVNFEEKHLALDQKVYKDLWRTKIRIETKLPQIASFYMKVT